MLSTDIFIHQLKQTMGTRAAAAEKTGRSTTKSECAACQTGGEELTRNCGDPVGFAVETKPMLWDGLSEPACEDGAGDTRQRGGQAR